MKLAIVMPVVDEASGIVETLRRLRPLRERGAQVIVVDGGSADATAALAAPHADRVLATARGRALQMNAGAAAAVDHADVLLFLHADTQLPEGADRSIADACAAKFAWGRFDVRIEGRSPLLPLIALLMNLRSRWTGICTGDQGLFVTRALFETVDGFPAVPLMEDIAFSRRARAITRPIALRTRVLTSGRRWERRGVVRTVLLMWRLRLAYFFGADPARLAESYRDAR